LGENKTRFNGWYVPAIQELDLALAGWDNKDPSFIIPKDTTGYASSTERPRPSSRYDGGNLSYKWYSSSKSKDYIHYNSAGSIICVYSVGM